MANGTLPAYLASAKPNPLTGRGPWYKNIAPSYFGIFMWIAFYNGLGSTLQFGSLPVALLGLIAAGLISHFLFYYVFGLLGMKTGLPLYVVGSSTFGTKGGYLFPGVFMGILQIGWYSVGTYFATDLVLRFVGAEPKTLLGPGTHEFSFLFVIVAIAWGYIFATIGAFGVQYVAKVSSYLPWVALAMLIVAGVTAAGSIDKFEPVAPAGASLNSAATFFLAIQMAIGFFATAGAAGVDFGTAARNSKDVNLGGLTGIALSIIVAGGLAVITVAGAHGKDPKLTAYEFVPALNVLLPDYSRIMFLLFAIGSMAPACFCSSIIGNSLSTMIPGLSRVGLTLGGATIGIVLAATGIAGNLVPFFSFIGASFGPICGAIVADYLLSGKKWAGPREGVSVAGYAAWIIGFVVGILNNPLVGVVEGWYPMGVASFFVGFIVYAVLAKAGLQGKPVAYAPANEQQA